jgi:lysophospholipase L1-like esterase
MGLILDEGGDRYSNIFRVGERPSMKRDHALSLAMIIGSLAFAAIGIELFVRVFVDDGMQFDLEMWNYARDVKQISADPMTGHGHRPNSEARLMGVDVKINSKGLRDREIPYERTPSTLRILMLGDSFTEGWGVPFERTFSKRIERLYAARGVAAEVINAGVGNYNTIMEVNYFLNEGHKYRPDIVVLNYVANDAEPVPRPAQPNPFTRACYSCVFVFGRVDALSRNISLRPGWAAYYLGLYGGGNAKGWLDAKAAIGSLAAYCRSHGIKLLIAHLPELHDVAHYPLQEITELVRQAAGENGAEFVDALPEFKGQEASTLWVSRSDPHPNALANELIANALWRKLESME